jgi:hypothetical protein
VSEKQTSQIGVGFWRNPCFSKGSDLHVIESRHEIRGDLCCFLFSYGVGRILLSTFKDVFQRSAVLGRATISKQFDGNGRKGQQEGDQDCSWEAGHGGRGVELTPVMGERPKRFYERQGGLNISSLPRPLAPLQGRVESAIFYW